MRGTHVLHVMPPFARHPYFMEEDVSSMIDSITEACTSRNVCWFLCTWDAPFARHPCLMDLSISFR